MNMQNIVIENELNRRKWRMNRQLDLVAYAMLLIDAVFTFFAVVVSTQHISRMTSIFMAIILPMMVGLVIGLIIYAYMMRRYDDNQYLRTIYTRVAYLLFIPLLYFLLSDHASYLLLLLKTTIQPQDYYAYSPGNVVASVMFWIMTPIYILCLLRRTGTIFAIFYALMLDFCVMGLFLTSFTIIYGIVGISFYYIAGFYFLLLGFMTVRYWRLSLLSILVLIMQVAIGITWRLTGIGNISYRFSLPTILDLSMIVLWYVFVLGLILPKRRYICECCKTDLTDVKPKDRYRFVYGNSWLCSYCIGINREDKCFRVDGVWIHT